MLLFQGLLYFLIATCHVSYIFFTMSIFSLAFVHFLLTFHISFLWFPCSIPFCFGTHLYSCFVDSSESDITLLSSQLWNLASNLFRSRYLSLHSFLPHTFSRFGSFYHETHLLLWYPSQIMFDPFSQVEFHIDGIYVPLTLVSSVTYWYKKPSCTPFRNLHLHVLQPLC